MSGCLYGLLEVSPLGEWIPEKLSPGLSAPSEYSEVGAGNVVQMAWDALAWGGAVGVLATLGPSWLRARKHLINQFLRFPHTRLFPMYMSC